MAQFFSLADLGLSTSQAQLLQSWLTAMQQNFPGYSPSAANLEYILAQVFASWAADVAQQCSAGSQELFRQFGTTLVQLPYQQGVGAQATVGVTAQPSPGTIATLSTSLTSAASVQYSTLGVSALQYGIAAGSVKLASGLNNQTWTTTGAVAGATSLPVTSASANFAYPTGSTFTGTQAYVIPALTGITLDSLGFQTTQSYTINAGNSQVVSVTAIQPGTIFNGAGAGGNAQFVQQTNWATTMTVVSIASGGVDPEDDTHYLTRLANYLTTKPGPPVTAADYATMAVNFQPITNTDQQLVGRATAVDGYDASTAASAQERTVTVCVTDAQGNALNNDTMYGIGGTLTTPVTANTSWGIEGWLRSLRELNFLVYVIAPTYNAIYVTVSVKGAATYDAATVQANVQTALLNYLTPSVWGLPPSSLSGWQNTTTLYQSALMNVIQLTPGVDHVLNGTLKFDVTPAPSNQNDLALTGPVALPTSDSTTTIQLSAITVT